jgi:hypothetical protein
MRRIRTWSSSAALFLLLCAGRAAHAAGPPSGAHPRFLLGSAKAGLVAQKDTPEVSAVVSQCASEAGETIASGYQGWDWVSQMASCAVAWHATGDAAHAAQAVKYWRALLDDGASVGDAGGGATGYNGGPIVSQDSGYSMRTFGAFGALGLDWLYDAPGVDDALRAHARDRLVAWHDWYAASGYLNETPESNYFVGYFLATWASAIAIGTDDARGADLWTAANALTDQYVRPAMKSGVFVGGDWIEGWQYGELAAQSYFVVSAAAAENGVTSFTDDFARDVVMFHIHALHPDGSFIDSGDQEGHPVEASNDSVWGALLAAPNAGWAGWAEQYATKASHDGVSPWVRALARARMASWAPSDWKDANLPLSYFAAGTQTLVARSGWGAGDTWASIQSAGRFGADHQHCDAGHFELIRGADALAITSADYGTWASWNNNTLLFDDGGDNSVYPPNQGAWGDPKKVALSATSEVGVASSAHASFADAYVSNQGGNSVKLAARDWIYLRPDVLVVSDRVAVSKPSVGVTFLLHTSTSPTASGAHLVADVGASRLSSQTLLPASPSRATVSEPVANAGSGPWSNNDTYAPAFRAEEQQSGATTASFVHVLTASAAGMAVADAELTVAGGARIVRIPGDPARIAVVSDAADGSGLSLPLTYSVPKDAHQDHVVFGLSGAAYSVAAKDDGSTCTLTLTAASDPHVVSDGAAAAFHLDDCVVGAPPEQPDGGVPDDPDGGTGEDGGGGGGASTGGDRLASDEPADGGCGCAFVGASPSGAMLSLALPALALIALRRARRTKPSRRR